MKKEISLVEELRNIYGLSKEQAEHVITLAYHKDLPIQLLLGLIIKDAINTESTSWCGRSPTKHDVIH
jgi:hypothetical protein